MLLDDNTIWLDLEIDPTSQALLLGAFLLDSDYWTFDQAKLVEQKQRVIDLLNQSAYLGGHNILEFDLPHLARLLSVDETTLANWQQKSIDTLYFSSLLQPHTRLAKTV